MSRLISGFAFYLLCFPLLAATKAIEEGAAPAPVETVGPIPIIIFGIVFVGSIVAFIWWYVRAKDDESPENKDKEAK